MGLREKKEVQTREKIFDVALKRFCEESIEGARLKDIARQAEVAERTLYRYFPTKEALAIDLYLANLRVLNDNSVFKELVTTRDVRSFRTNMKVFKPEIIDGIRDIPERLLYDLLFNVFAARRHEDPSQYEAHFMQRNWFKAESASWGESGALVMEAVSMLLAYAQRLVMLEYQQAAPDWETVIERFETVFDCSVQGCAGRLREIGRAQ